jgi:hypothetical protein
MNLLDLITHNNLKNKMLKIAKLKLIGDVHFRDIQFELSLFVMSLIELSLFEMIPHQEKIQIRKSNKELTRNKEFEILVSYEFLKNKLYKNI